MVIYLCDRTRLLALHLQLSSRRLQFLPAATKLGQGNIFTGVCLSTGGGGVSASVHAGIYPPEQTPPQPDTHTPRPDTPPDQTPPPRPETPTPPRAGPPDQTRHPPEQTPPGPDTHPRADTPSPQTRHTPGPETPWEQTPPEHTPPGPDTPQEQTPQTRHTPLEQTPPPREADFSIRSMSGRYASYWNAFLLEYESDSVLCEHFCIISYNPMTWNWRPLP